MTYDGQGEAAGQGLVTSEEARRRLSQPAKNVWETDLLVTIIALSKDVAELESANERLTEERDNLAAAEHRVRVLEKALRQIEAVGTKEKSIRAGDAYDLERGYRDYITQTEEAKIAQAALRAEP